MLVALNILTDSLTVKMLVLFCEVILIYPAGRILQKVKTFLESKMMNQFW
jgi:hypothetical protein